MINSTITFLQFNGNCSQALEFYQDAFSANILEKTTLGQADLAKNEAEANLVMYSMFTLGEQKFGACDISDDTKHTVGNQISIWLEIDTQESIDTIYSYLEEKGCTVIMELADSLWESKYAKVQDMFGVMWELNCQI